MLRTAVLDTQRIEEKTKTKMSAWSVSVQTEQFEM